LGFGGGVTTTGADEAGATTTGDGAAAADVDVELGWDAVAAL